MRKLLILSPFLSFAFTGFAQHHRNTISLGPDLGIPTSSFGSANLGFGGSFDYNHRFSMPIGVNFHVGYNSFASKLNTEQKVSFLPVTAGVVAFLYKDIFFANINAGISRYHSPSTETKQNGFIFSTGVGYKIPLNESGHFVQMSGYYNVHHYKGSQSEVKYNYNWFNVRAAYGIGWGRKVR